MHVEMSLRLKGMLAVAVFALVGAAACGGGTEEAAPESAAEPMGETAAEESSGEPRVFFVAPIDETDHATEIPLGITFGIENFEIGAVPEEVTTVREGVGHYHLALDTDCLPPGEIIPSADPWVHFGDGSDGMEMQLEGGEYRLTVQIGDDEHRTLEGLCDTIVVRMEDGI